MRPQELIEHAISLLGEGGVAILDVDHHANIRFANNTLTTNGMMIRQTMTVIATAARSGGVSSGVMSRVIQGKDVVTALCAAAQAIARENPPAPDAQELVTGERPTTAWSGEPGTTSLDAFANFAPALGESFAIARSAAQTLYGFTQHEVRTTYLGTTSGVRLRHEQRTATLEMTARDGTSSAWYGVGSTDVDFDPRAGTAELQRRLGWANRRIDIAPGRHRVLIPPTAVADLMIYLYWSAGARAAYEGRSAFSVPGQKSATRLGEHLTARPISLFSDAAFPGIGCAPFAIARASMDTQSVFDNGLALQPTSWIDNGTLSTLVGSRADAAEFALPARPGIDNLVMTDASATASSIDDLVSGVDSGLLLTCLWYIREVDPTTLLLTGLTRDGVYVVEDGQVVGTTTNFRFNESPIDLLARISATSRSERTLPREWNDWFTRTVMPAAVVEEFNFSSVAPGI
jgi:predicted Zn-dependent protease